MEWDVYCTGPDHHVVPAEDLKPHVISERCWCAPYEDLIDIDVWIHNAMDQRELFEQGKRLPS